MVTLISSNNVHLAVAPPSYNVPNTNGAAVPAGLTSWDMTVVSSRYAAGSSADLAVEYLYGGSWIQTEFVGGFPLGPYACDGGGVVGVTDTVNPTISVADRSPVDVGWTVTISGVQGATGVNGTWTVASVLDSTNFTITAAAPGVYTGGGSVTTATGLLHSNVQLFGEPYPTRVRLRIDRVASGTLDSVVLVGN